MSILTPAFSERVFEFSFNAEYANRNSAVLAGVPSIPTQNEEKWLGYDVAFELKRRGGAVHAIALQHKVSRRVDTVGPKNRHFWRAIGGPYFAFRLDIDQYNLIEAISSVGLPGIEFYFCAPAFVSRKDMNEHYVARTVEMNSVWIDVSGAGQITDTAAHTIVYSPEGSKAFRFSDTAIPLKTVSDELRRARWADRRNGSLESAERIYEVAFSTLRKYWPTRRRTKVANAEGDYRLPEQLPDDQEPTIANTAKLLAYYFGTSMLVEVRV
jgi:hypothetical protein